MTSSRLWYQVILNFVEHCIFNISGTFDENRHNSKEIMMMVVMVVVENRPPSHPTSKDSSKAQFRLG